MHFGGNTLHQSEGHHSKALDRIKSEEFKFVRVDMSRSYSFDAKGKSNFADEDDPLSYSLRSGETSGVNKGKFKAVEKSSMRRKVEAIDDETTFSEKVSTQQLTESSIKWKNSGSSSCCQSLDISESDFEHFPMREINRKIESLLASKKKSSYGAVSVKIVTENLSLCESTGTSSLVELAPGSCLAAKHYEGFLPDNAADMDGASSPVIHGCKYQKTNMVACMFSSGLTYLDPMNNNLCSCCSSSKSMTTGIKRKTSSISEGLGNSWTSLKGGSTHLLRESSPADFPYSFLPERHVSEVKGDSPMPNCSKHDMSLPESCQILKSVDYGERCQKFSSTVKYLLVADKVEKYQCLRKQTKGDSTFTQVYANTSSTLPTKQNYGKKKKSTAPLQKFVSDEDMNDCDDNDAHLIAEHNEFLTNTDTVYSHPSHRSSSLPGESFSRSQKGITSSNLRNPNPVFASSGDVSTTKVETGMAEKREAEHAASTHEATDARHRKASVSSTESLAADHHIASQVRASDASSSNPLPNHTSGSETCSRWIKRLQDNHSKTAPCTKRFRRGDDSSNGDSDEFVQLWRRRWRHSGDESSSTASMPSVPLTLLPEKSSAALEKFEGKMSASIGGMALMGKAMKNYRPYRIRREEGCLVWNTGE
ncbi:uncharacterized protein LOC110022698 [Phalaenopsis equestris]|uniref:uncharacterized protein LOC110022698 n=1 Tax=Phalaenopsis equestris TaxID=78828 RepID=UPI0009E199DD|nr:uncharacterized protein LOC110022698 [Phalaenopsis equestris]